MNHFEDAMDYKVWKVNPFDPNAANNLAASLGVPSLLAKLLVSRGVTDEAGAQALLGQPAPMADPFAMQDMQKAVARIHRAIDEEEPILVFGDYDADGVTATAILTSHLRSMGANVRCMLPSREGEGYGLSEKTVRSMAQKGFKLVVTVDNGISAVEEADLAYQLGMQMVITDHHLPGPALPRAEAVVDPMRQDDTSGCNGLCGAGVAFMLCAALADCPPEDLLDEYADLAAIGTVADVMPLLGDNRTLVRHGLQLLNTPFERPGLLALLKKLGLANEDEESGEIVVKPILSENISFAISPRINAAGRMGSAGDALSLLLCEDDQKAELLAQRLCDANARRQEEEARIFKQATDQIADDPSLLNNPVLIIAGEGFHRGVIGITANKLMEKYGKPAIVVAIQGEECRGSGRSIEGINLHEALEHCAPLLSKYGGHKAAAGLTVSRENLPAFIREINEYISSQYPILPPPVVSADIEVGLDELNPESVQSLNWLEPYGNSNASPCFVVRSALVEGVYPLGDRHTRVRLRQNKTGLYCAAFHTLPQQFAYPMGSLVDAVISVSIFNSKTGPMVSGRLVAIRPAGMGDAHCQSYGLYAAMARGAQLNNAQKALLMPDRTFCGRVYKAIGQERFAADDLRPLFHLLGEGDAGKIMVSLAALLQLGLIRKAPDDTYALVPQAPGTSKDLFSASVFKRLNG